jgi:hypothetical protein
MTERCVLFNNISKQVWDDVTDFRKFGPEPREDSFTPNIIKTIRKVFHKDNSVGIWANQSYIEKKHGGDLDIFVESRKGHFIWYPLQAKVLKRRGTYEAICHGGDYQWKKLGELSKNGDCYPYFLLYNGGEEFDSRYSGKDSCGEKYPVSQLGCSLVDLNTVKDKCLDLNGNCRPPSFDDFHLHHEAEPWRVLVCCEHSTNARTFTLEQVQMYTEPYRLVSDEVPKGFEQEVFLYATGQQNKLVDLAKENNYESDKVLVFTNDFQNDIFRD